MSPADAKQQRVRARERTKAGGSGESESESEEVSDKDDESASDPHVESDRDDGDGDAGRDKGGKERPPSPKEPRTPSRPGTGDATPGRTPVARRAQRSAPRLDRPGCARCMQRISVSRFRIAHVSH